MQSVTSTVMVIASVALAGLPGCSRDGFGTIPESPLLSTSPTVLARPDYVLGIQDRPLVIAALDNDEASPGEAFGLSQLAAPVHGQALLGPGPSEVTYLPRAGFVGTDSFVYEVETDSGARDTARVTVRVAVPFTWTGAAGDGAWSTPLNWLGGAVPNEQHLAVFDDLCATSSDVLIDAAVEVSGLELRAGYIGTVTQGPGQTLRILRGGFTQEAGDFVGSDASIDIGGNVRLSGGTFRSTTGVLSVGGSWATHNSGGLIISGGSFVHAEGSLRFNGAKAFAPWTTVAFVDVAERLELWNLVVEVFDPDIAGGHDGAVVRLADSAVVAVHNELRLRDGKLVGGRIELAGDLVTSCESIILGICAEGGLTPVVMNGNTTQRYWGAGSASTASFMVVDTSGTVEPGDPAASYGLSGLRVINGTFVSPSGVLRFHIDREADLPGGSADLGFQLWGGAYVDNVGRYDLDVRVGLGGTEANVFAIDVAFLPMAGLSVRVDDYDPAGGFNEARVVLSPSTWLRIDGRLLVHDGRLDEGVVEAQSTAMFDCTDARACVGGGTTSIVLSGPEEQVLHQQTGSTSAELPGAVVTVEKKSGRVIMTSPLWLVGNQDLYLAAGTLDLVGYPLTVGDRLVLDSGSAVVRNGGLVTYGTLVSNGGAILP
jgi:hypothetical protein